MAESIVGPAGGLVGPSGAPVGPGTGAGSTYPEPPADMVLVITDINWDHLIESPNVLSLEIDEELGSAENRATVSILASDPIAEYIPNPDTDASVPRRFKVYTANVLAFAGLIDKTTSRIDADGILTFGGIQRGGEMAERNFGRRDLLGWPLPELFRELLRDNIGRAPFATASADGWSEGHEPVNAITGEPQAGQYWGDTIAGGGSATPRTLTIDLGSIQTVDAIRVIPEWTTGKEYTWVLSTSTDGSAYAERYNYNQTMMPTSDRGILVEVGGIQARYVQLLVGGASDGSPRIAAVLTYQNLAEPGSDTTYSVPWIENDDSGNITLAGTTSRVVVDGAFAGDGVLGNSFVTQLGAGGSMSHTFRGTSNAVYFTEADASTVDFYVDSVLQAADVAIPAGSYQYKGFEVTGLSASQHTLQVVRKTGSPQVDYFSGEYQSSYRVVQENSTAIGYSGKWSTIYGDGFSSHAVRSTRTAGVFQFPFYGDSLKVRFSTGPGMGQMNWYIDGAHGGTVDLYSASPAFQYVAINWSGAYDSHTLRVAGSFAKNAASTGYEVQLDSIEGNWAHIIYLRSAYDTNLSLIGRLSEMTNTFMRLNYDGTVDLLGAIGSDSGEIIREGENEGGQIQEGEVEGDWSDAISAVLAIGRGTDNLALRVFVMDKPAVERLGVKVVKIENRDAVDAYLLVRQAWQTLQDGKYPRRNYRVTWSDGPAGIDPFWYSANGFITMDSGLFMDGGYVMDQGAGYG